MVSFQRESLRCLLGLFVGILMMSGPAAATENAYGTWQGKRYDFYFSEDSGNIWGTWGAERSDFYVQHDSGNIWGSIAGKRFDLHISQSSTNIWGTLPCGRTDFHYTVSSRNIWGTLCGESFDVHTATQEEVVPAAENMYLPEILKELPSIIEQKARQFIKARISL